MMAAIQGARESAPSIGELARLPATDLLAGYRSGSFTPSDVVEEVIGALEQTDAVCNVMVTPMFESAREEAKAASKAKAVKDKKRGKKSKKELTAGA